jgi:hypothetical protein
MHTGGLARSGSNLPNASEPTITPAPYAQKQSSEVLKEDWTQLPILGIFDIDEDLEPGLRSELPDCLRGDEDAEGEFVLSINLDHS